MGRGCEYYELNREYRMSRPRKVLSPSDAQCQVATRTMNGDIVIAGTRSYIGETAGVQRYDSNLDLVWDHGFYLVEDDFPTGVIELSDGSIVVAEKNIRKLDADGNRLWSKFFAPGQGYSERGGGIVEVEHLSIISSMNSGGDIWVHKIAKFGRLLWRKKLSTAGSLCYQERNAAPVYGAVGNYFVGCTTNLHSRGPENYRVHKLSPRGQVLWKKTITEISSTIMYSMLADEDGGVVLGGSNIIKLDARGNIEWEMSSQYITGPMQRTPYGYAFRVQDGFQEIVPNIKPSDTYTPSGSIVSLKSSIAGLFLSKDSSSQQVYAESRVARFAAQWVVIGELAPAGSFFSLRSAVNGRMANLLNQGTKVVLKASKKYSPRSEVLPSDSFRLRNLGAGEVAVQSGDQMLGYLRPEEGVGGGRIIASRSRQPDRNMKVSLISGPIPLSGSKVILRWSRKNLLLETIAGSQVRAEKKILPSKIKAFLFKVVHLGNGRVELQSALTGQKLEANIRTGRVAAWKVDSLPSDNAEFFMDIGKNGYISLTSAAPTLRKFCLFVDSGGWIVANRVRRGSQYCEILAASTR
ncbi:hypothetical protein NDN08_004872 [Rhodosorus marinus]|uniref:ER membrane protein complex subunit 1 n=1 Tax=Rhodosorus marinus TaxID=101924 RepID=A0AAV8UEV1_9RHOD|nr:hypothetical protein NDN08_004872 [Rhodosorus marinus]